MSIPDYPMSVARDRFGLWLHATGLSLREVVQALPEHFQTGALLVYEPQQLDYATSVLLDRRRQSGRSREDLLADLADLEDHAFWNRVEPLFENDSCAVWPGECLDEMVLVQGPEGGGFGLCPVEPHVARNLAADFVYEHPSNVQARLAFLSVGDSVTSVFLTSEEDLLRLVRHVVAKALTRPGAAPNPLVPEQSVGTRETGPEQAADASLVAGDAPVAARVEGLDEVARGLRAWLEEGGVDLRGRDEEPSFGDRPSATVALGLWTLRSQWPLLWRRVRVADIAWDGRSWRLSEVREEPGRRFISGIRLVGEIFHGMSRLMSYLLVFGLPLVAAALTWALSGWIAGVLALLVAVLLWPKYVLGANWRELRERRAREEEHTRKYGL